MKYVAGFLFCWFLFLSNAMAKLVSGDVLISSDAYVSNETWYITDSVEIENNGVIKNDIYVCNMCDVYVKNTGVISANFYLGQGAKIIQVISNTDDITHVDFGGVYSVKIDDADGVALDSVAKIAYGADKIVIIHNHPSGNPYPSDSDIKLTKRFFEAGKLFGIEVIDHIIIGNGVFSSLKKMNKF